MKYGILTLIVTSLALGGCGKTSLSSAPDPDYSVRTQGIPYRLPITQVEVAASWSLTDCATITYTFDAVDGQNDAAQPVKSAVLTTLADPNAKLYLRLAKPGAPEVVALPKVPDPDNDRWPTVGQVEAFVPNISIKPNVTYSSKTIEGETLIIDYQKLTQAFKTGSISVEYHKGTQLLKSVNASVQGQEAEALKATVGALANIGRVAIGLGTGIPESGSNDGAAITSKRKTQVVQQCTEIGRNSVLARNAAVKAVKKAEGDVAKISARIAKIQATIATNASDEDVVKDEKAKLKAAKLELSAINTLIKAEKAVIALEDKRITVTKKVTMPDKNNTYPNVIQPSTTELENKFKTIFSQNYKTLRFQDIIDKTRLSLSLEPISKSAKSCVNPKDLDADGNPIGSKPGCTLNSGVANPHNGLVFRTPVPSVLTITPASANKPLLTKKLNVIQFGRVRELPLVNAFGESNSLEAIFDEQGVPSKIVFSKTSSGSLAALNALNDAAQTIAKLQSDIEAKEAAELAAANALAAQELTDLERSRDLLSVQGEIDALLNPATPVTPEPTQLETLQAELAVLEATYNILSVERQIAEIEALD